jgi:hypothetical protein
MRRKAAFEFEYRSGDLLQTLLYEMVAGQLESLSACNISMTGSSGILERGLLR